MARRFPQRVTPGPPMVVLVSLRGLLGSHRRARTRRTAHKPVQLESATTCNGRSEAAGLVSARMLHRKKLGAVLGTAGPNDAAVPWRQRMRRPPTPSGLGPRR